MIDRVIMVQNVTRNFAVALAERIHRALERHLRFAAEQQHAIA